MPFILQYWKQIVLVLILLAYSTACWHAGASHVQAKWDAEHAANEAAAAKVAVEQAKRTAELVADYEDKLRAAQETKHTIIKRIPVYVTAQADAACTINRGFVRLHDASAAGADPGAPTLADAAPSGVALSAVAGTVAENYGSCRENAEQLVALQRWVGEMRAAR